MKIINPNDKGGYRVEQLQTKYPKLTTVEQIQSELTEQSNLHLKGNDLIPQVQVANHPHQSDQIIPRI